MAAKKKNRHAGQSNIPIQLTHVPASGERVARENALGLGGDNLYK